MNRIITIAVSMLACLLLSCAAFAAGGIYFDEFLVTNNGTSILADSFDSGDLAGWKADNASVLRTQMSPAKYCVCLNKMDKNRSQVQRDLSLDDVGTLELSAWIYLPQPEQQSNYGGSRCEYAGFSVYAKNPDDHLVASLFLQPKGKGYRAEAHWHDAVKQNTLAKSSTSSPVITGGKWANATMRLDPAKKTVSLLIDGKLACRISYVPERFQSISSVILFSDLGG